mmetsp:Transcript_23005/g.57160  ORF Transcript_23005/g.57160 Transcript_23005/m.57160 type:complete len:82 (+) Transcript_23005:1430-1675(+)
MIETLTEKCLGENIYTDLKLVWRGNHVAANRPVDMSARLLFSSYDLSAAFDGKCAGDCACETWRAEASLIGYAAAHKQHAL